MMMMVLRSLSRRRRRREIVEILVETGIVFVVFVFAIVSVSLPLIDLRRLLQPRHSRRWWIDW